MEPYFKLAAAHNYRVHCVTVENRHHGQNTHGIPDEHVQRMAAKYKVVLCWVLLVWLMFLPFVNYHSILLSHFVLNLGASRPFTSTFLSGIPLSAASLLVLCRNCKWCGVSACSGCGTSSHSSLQAKSFVRLSAAIGGALLTQLLLFWKSNRYTITFNTFSPL